MGLRPPSAGSGGGVITAQGPFTQSTADALLQPGQTLYETDAGGNVVAEWVKTTP